MKAYQLVGILLLLFISLSQGYVANIEEIKEEEKYPEMDRQDKQDFDLMEVKEMLAQAKELKDTERKIEEQQPPMR